LATHPPEAGHGHGHGAHEPHSGPEPHESPWPMTLPLVVLGFFALVAGFFNPALPGMPGSSAPAMEHWLEPVFAGAEELVKLRPGASGPWLMAMPGILVAFIGSGFAYFVYQLQGGAPARALAERVPKLYQLVVDKWRIDELYEATVIGAVESLAETSALFDKWFIDGILAKVTSLLVQGFGSVLRAVQTGVVHVYASVMAIGLAAFGWFFVWHPQARATVHSGAAGRYVVEASPGLGYEYRWHTRSPESPDSDAFSSRRSVEVDVGAGESKVVKVDVKNAFGRVSTGSVVVSAPAPARPERASLDVKGGTR
jgi:NADH-quinone oxidoreductase subunit L